MNASDVFRSATDAFNRGDMEAFRASLHPYMRFSPDPTWPDVGDYRGREQFMAFLRDFTASFSSVRLELDDLQEVRGWGAARCRWVVEGAASGIATDVAFTFVGTLRDGQMYRLHAYFDHDQALAAIP